VLSLMAGPVGVQAAPVPAAFLLSGFLTGYTRDPFVGDPGPAVFSTNLVGRGTAALSMSSGTLDTGTMVRDFVRLIYTFEAA
jgi:hypothetical protein